MRRVFDNYTYELSQLTMSEVCRMIVCDYDIELTVTVYVMNAMLNFIYFIDMHEQGDITDEFLIYYYQGVKNGMDENHVAEMAADVIDKFEERENEHTVFYIVATQIGMELSACDFRDIDTSKLRLFLSITEMIKLTPDTEMRFAEYKSKIEKYMNKILYTTNNRRS